MMSNIPATPPGLVLCIDDDAFILELVRHICRERGLQIVCGSTAPEALSALEDHRPDLVLLDIDLPGMPGAVGEDGTLPGFRLCETLRQELSPNAPAIIFFSGHHTEQIVKKAMAAGGTDFIAKPAAAKTIQDRIDKWLQ